MPGTALASPWSPIGARLRITAPRTRPYAVLAALAVATIGGVVLLLGPATGTDLAAQQARASFAGAHPGAAVDFRWYGGVLPAAYSVLAPYAETAVGVRVAGVMAAVAAAGLLAHLLLRWGARRPVAAAAWGAAAFLVNVVSGRVAFGLGLAVGLAALAVVPGPGAKRRRWIAPIALAAITTLTSPVAGAFLGLVALAWALRRRGVASLALVAAAPMAVVALAFHEPGRMPFTWSVARPVLLACVAVAVLCPARPVRSAAVVYGIATFVVYLAPGPVGSNVERLALLFTGVVVLAATAVRWPVLVVALAITAQWTARVPLTDLFDAGAVRTEHAAAHRLTSILDRLGPREGRVEVVPFLDHGEAGIVANAWPLARGWERQLDTVRAAPLYRASLDATAYRAWLDSAAVQYVALGAHRHDWSAAAEIKVLRAGVPGLEVVYRDAEWTVWRVLDARPIVTGGHLVAMTPDRVVVEAATAGPMTVAVLWSRWLTVSSGACIARVGNDVVIRPRHPGAFTLSSSYLAVFDGHHC